MIAHDSYCMSCARYPHYIKRAYNMRIVVYESIKIWEAE